MEHLPFPLFSIVVAFAVHDYSEELVPNKRKLPVEGLQTLALVCKPWSCNIQSLVSRFQLSTFTLQVSTGSRSELLAIQRRLADHGAPILDLRVCFKDAALGGPFPRRNAGFPSRAETRDDVEIPWEIVLSRLPTLQRLDLSQVPLPSKHVALILQNAAKFCRNIEAVMLSGVEDFELSQVDFTSICGALYAAMETWRAGKQKTGLRQLTVPAIGEVDRFKACKTFFDNVVAYCPDVEYVDGYKQTLCELDKLTCRDDWMITLEQWEKFNATCTKLREFHWVVAPFGDPFFRVFGEYVKPQLKKLTLAVNMLWEWDSYFEACELGSGPARAEERWLNEIPERPGYGIHATDVSSAIKGCPALDDLKIELYHPVDGDDFGYDPYDDDIDDFPDREVINIHIFDDDFCETLAVYCPLLTSFSIWEVAKGQNSNLKPIKTFTDRGLVALAQLKFLSEMQLRTVNCTGKGVFDFLNRLSDEFMGQRTFQICLGGSPSDSKLAFYIALTKFLTKLVEMAPRNISFIRRKLVLRLMNSNFDSVDAKWSKSYFRRLEKLVKSVKQKHPSLRLRITTSGRRGKAFRSIIELGLYTAEAEPSPWYGWDDEESNRDVTFVNRSDGVPFDQWRRRMPVELRHPELLDPDSLPIDYELPADYFDDYGGYGDYGDYGDYDDYDDYLDYGDYDDGDFYDGNADELWE